MKFLVVVQPSAQAEMEAAYQWVAERAPLTAARWYNRLLKAIQSLADYPERCSIAPEDAFFPEEIRNLPYGKRMHAYRVISRFAATRSTCSISAEAPARYSDLKPRKGPNSTGGQPE
jgi:plasmid stabilization system protein ParE